MRETIEFRIPETLAGLYLPADVGVKFGTVRKLELASHDPLLGKIHHIDQKLRLEGRALFTAWIPHRRYSRQEIDGADLFHAWPKKTFEPAGEECGTAYADSRACPKCGGGAPQTTPLYLDGRRIPSNVDFAQTIADELVVSRRAVDVFRNGRLRGAKFDPVRLSNKGGTPSEDHYQLLVIGPPVELHPVTRVGEDPFDEDSSGHCPRGDVIGLNLLSEVTVKRSSLSDADVMATKQMVGVRRGLLRPRRSLLLSPRARRVIDDAELKGLAIEIAHLS
jgi:hypothetical protein